MICCVSCSLPRQAVMIVLMIFIVIQNIHPQILQPKNIVVQLNQTATIMFNTTKGTHLLAVNFGLCMPLHGRPYNCDVKPKFLSFNPIHGLKLSTDLDDQAVSYNGRVFFIGNLTLGYAWFTITNMTLNDSNTYAAGIRTNTDEEYKVFTVNVTVTNHITVKKSKNPIFPAKPTTRRISRSRRYFSETEKILSYRPTTSPASYVAFEVTAETAVLPNKTLSVQTKRAFRSAVKRAYRNNPVQTVILNYFKKVNETIITVKFTISFTLLIGQAFAYSFLQKAQENNKLLGYNITCFSYIDIPIKPTKTRDQNVLLTTFIWLFIVVIIIILVAVVAVVMLYKCPSLRQQLVLLWEKWENKRSELPRG